MSYIKCTEGWRSVTIAHSQNTHLFISILIHSFTPIVIYGTICLSIGARINDFDHLLITTPPSTSSWLPRSFVSALLTFFPSVLLIPFLLLSGDHVCQQRHWWCTRLANSFPCEDVLYIIECFTACLDPMQCHYHPLPYGTKSMICDPSTDKLAVKEFTLASLCSMGTNVLDHHHVEGCGGTQIK